MTDGVDIATNVGLRSVRYGSQITGTRTGKFTGAAIAAALHLIAVVALLQYAPVRSALTNAVPLMVSLITPPPIEKPKIPPKTLPVKPSVQQVKPLEPPPVLTVAPDVPSPQVAPLQPPPAPPPPVAVEVVAPIAPISLAPSAPPAPVTPPNFNADYLKNPPPAYPAVARRQGQQGRVILRVLVNAAGGADQVEIRNGTGHSMLDTAALEAVRRWRFVPARQGDQPIAAWVLVPITFTLEG